MNQHCSPCAWFEARILPVIQPWSARHSSVGKQTRSLCDELQWVAEGGNWIRAFWKSTLAWIRCRNGRLAQWSRTKRRQCRWGASQRMAPLSGRRTGACDFIFYRQEFLVDEIMVRENKGWEVEFWDSKNSFYWFLIDFQRMNSTHGLNSWNSWIHNENQEFTYPGKLRCRVYLAFLVPRFWLLCADATLSSRVTPSEQHNLCTGDALR